MNVLRTTGLAAALACVLAQGVDAQVTPREFQVTPFGGTIMMDEASAIDDHTAFGLEAVYYVTGNLAIGIGGSYGRSVTDGSFFPPLNANLGPSQDTTLAVSQDVSVATYGLVAKLGIGAGRLTPYVAGGVGGYALFLDVQSNNGPSAVGDIALELGAGAHFRISDRAGLRLNVRDIIFTGFDRDKLNPVDPFFWGDFDPSSVPEEKSTLHNIRIDLGFSYVPSR